MDKDSPERLRAFCVDELNRIASHSFGKAKTILESINRRLERMSEWMRTSYKERNFVVDRELLEGALHIEEDEQKVKYLYLIQVYEDERIIEKELRRLADLPDISLKIPISKEKFIVKLAKKDSILMKIAKDRYKDILDCQAESCMQIFCKPLSVISGAAGTGKTTVIQSIISNITRVDGVGTQFLIMAPTGKATERIKKQTQKDVTPRTSTIHSFLAKNGWINENFTFKVCGGTQYKDINTIIIDECSMIDLNLFATLIRAINWNSVKRLILVGDPNQLPPIGRGRVFSDVIEWLRKDYPDNIAVLKENVRQLVNDVNNKGNGILSLASMFIQENQKDKDKFTVEKETMFKRLQEPGNIEEDLSVYYWNEQNDLQEKLHNIIISDLQQATGKTTEEIGGESELWFNFLRDENKHAQPERIQVISPYRGEFYGTDDLNRFMQRTFNKYAKKGCQIDGISVFDKVIQYRNRPKTNPASVYNRTTQKNEYCDVYNGEIGVVRFHGFEKNRIKARWNRIWRFQVEFSGEEKKNLYYNYGKDLGKTEKGKYIDEQKPIDNLELAYVISVHKSQGSEFDYVYIIIPKRDSHLLSMELIYTAITRAQRHVTLLIQDDVGTLVRMSRLEKSAVRRINSSLFYFNPLPEELLYYNSWYESGKALATLTEYFVRSKSEVIIANMLFSENIDFKYEIPLYTTDGTMYLPDFTVTFRGETYYWEHIGMLNDKKYMEHWRKKEKWYQKHYPDRLIVTYEDNNLSKQVQDIIKKYK